MGPAPLQAFTAGAPPLHRAISLAEAAAAAVREGCIGETVAALLAAEQARGARDADVRAALEKIAGDEARHAELAWRFVAWAADRGGSEVRAAVARAFAEGFAAIPLPAAQTEGVDAAAWVAFGRLGEEATFDVAHAAIRDVIAPCATALSSTNV
jgi:hypothetical protein